MTIRCRFCEEYMECVEITNTRNGHEGLVSGRFKCNCKGFIENGSKQIEYDRKIMSRLDNGKKGL